MIGIIAEKACTRYTDIRAITVSIPESVTSLRGVCRLQKNEQMCWNGELEEEKQFSSKWQEGAAECAFIAWWYL